MKSLNHLCYKEPQLSVGLFGAVEIMLVMNESVDVVSSDILSRNGKSATMQDQSQGKTR